MSCFSFFLSFILSLGLQGPTCASLAHYRCANRAHHTWGLLSQKLKLFIWASCPTHVLYFRMYLFSPLYASIWLKFWPSWVAWLLYLCPTFPLIRLEHKGSTSAIVTTGSAGCVPQTGWSRKLAFLREYSVGEQKMFFVYYNMNPQMFCFLRFCLQFGHAHRCMRTQGKEPLPELFSLEDVSYYPCNIT